MAEKRSGRARAHHVLPQFYLRAWANADGAVGMLDRRGREVLTGTAALGVEKDFYTVADHAGRKTSMVEEEVLARTDAKGAEVHRRLLADDFPLDDDDRLHFGLWMGLQWLRGREARAIGRESYDAIHKLLVRLGLDLPESLAETYPGLPPPGAGPGVPVPSLAHLPEETKAVLRDTDAYVFEPSQEHLVASMVRNVPSAAEPFIRSQWVLLRTRGLRLLTSDEPISLWREPTPENEHLGLGPVNADIIQLPLSPDRCLLMVREDAHADLLTPETDAGITDINRLTLHDRWSQLFRHPDGPAFPALPPPPPEPRITVG